VLSPAPPVLPPLALPPPVPLPPLALLPPEPAAGAPPLPSPRPGESVVGEQPQSAKGNVTDSENAINRARVLPGTTTENLPPLRSTPIAKSLVKTGKNAPFA
jgi:hypothetical protein